MADKKISALTASATPLAGTEVLPIVQSGATVKVSAANITAGRAVSTLSVASNGPNGIPITMQEITAAPSSATAAYVGVTTSAFPGGANGDLVLIPRSSSTNDVRILVGSGTPTDALVVQGSTKNILASAGNLVVGTAGKGIVDSTSAVTLNFSSTAVTLNSPLAQTGAINVITNDFTGHINGAFALNNTATIANLANGFIEIAENAFGACALIMVGTGATTIISQSSFLLFSTTAGNPGTVNVYKSGANVIIENKNAATLTIVTSIRKLG